MTCDEVALHPEGVDRNTNAKYNIIRKRVALHPEGVDRNTSYISLNPLFPVALHPEGVDRNKHPSLHHIEFGVSPSTRRAWIEIERSMPFEKIFASPSTRRAWIEIQRLRRKAKALRVALHPEGVDRNTVP